MYYGQSLIHFLQSLELEHFFGMGLFQFGPIHALQAVHSLDFWHIVHALHSSGLSFPGHFHIQFPFLSFSPTPSFLHLCQHLPSISEHFPQGSVPVPIVVTLIPSVVFLSVVTVFPTVVWASDSIIKRIRTKRTLEN